MTSGRTPAGLTVLIGGARSGKSSLAEKLGRCYDDAGGSVTYVATAPVVDDDMAERIDRHRMNRPAGWRTIEEEVDLIGALHGAGDDLAIVDCLTLWVSNLLYADRSEAEIITLADRTATVSAGRSSPTVVVTNEVGLGVHPDTELGRRYRDILGRVNQIWTQSADRNLLLVAGRAVALVNPDSLW